MPAVIAFVCFLISFIMHGGDISGHSVWFTWQSFMLLGLVFTALHLISRPWKWWP